MVAGSSPVVLALSGNGLRQPCLPADAVVIWHSNLSADESLLTGESVPVRKTTWDGQQATARPGGDDLPFVFSGSLIVHGQGVARVHATGDRTEMGRIGTALQSVEIEGTLLQREVARLVRNLAFFGIGLCVLVVVIYGVTHHDWLNGLLAGITLAMAMLPEEFPVVLTVFLALGAWRLSKMQVLTRRVPAVETLGAAILATEPFAQVRDQFAELGQEGFLGQTHRFFKASRHAGLFLAKQLRAQLTQVVRRLDAGKVMLQAKQTNQRMRVITRVVQAAETIAGGLLELVKLGVELCHRLTQFVTQSGHLHVEPGDVVLADESDPGLGIRQAQAFPQVQGTATHRSHRFERRVLRVEQLFGGTRAAKKASR